VQEAPVPNDMFNVFAMEARYLGAIALASLISSRSAVLRDQSDRRDLSTLTVR
jgi:hypothetical protein